MLRATRSLSGRLLAHDGLPARYVELEAVPESSAGKKTYRPSALGRQRTRTDEEGRFHFARLDPGKVRILRDDDYVKFDKKLDRLLASGVETGRDDLVLTLSEDGKHAFLVLDIRNEAGDALEGEPVLSVMSAMTGEGKSWGGKLRYHRGRTEDQAYRFGPVPEVRFMRITLSGIPGYRSTILSDVEVSADGSDKPIEVILKPDRDYEARVEFADGTPAEDALIHLEPIWPDGSGPSEASTLQFSGAGLRTRPRSPISFTAEVWMATDEEGIFRWAEGAGSRGIFPGPSKPSS